MDRAPAAATTPQDRADLLAAQRNAARKAERMELARILRDRDDALQYAIDHDRDDTGRLPHRASCGCEPLKPCDWHQHVEHELHGGPVETYYDHGHWHSYRPDNYDGAPDSHCPLGTGRTREAAEADLREQEQAREEA